MMVKPGDHIKVSDAHNAFNKRNGLPRFRRQEVLAVLKPGEAGADYGFHGPNYGYLNYSEDRLLINNAVGSSDGKTIFWPFNHDAPDLPPPEFAEVKYTTTTIVDLKP